VLDELVNGGWGGFFFCVLLFLRAVFAVDFCFMCVNVFLLKLRVFFFFFLGLVFGDHHSDNQNERGI
jgi:hypothetical protein